jgi:hypothetical protein
MFLCFPPYKRGSKGDFRILLNFSHIEYGTGSLRKGEFGLHTYIRMR